MKIIDNNKDFIIETIETVKKTHPEIKNINIRYKRNKEGQFITHMDIQHGRKKFSATKAGYSIQKSLANTRHAILKQIEKFSHRHKKFFYKNNPLTH